jgi:hypothetical protein
MGPYLTKPLKEFVQQVMAERGRGWKVRQALHFGMDAANADPDNGWWRRKSTRRHIVWENAVNKLVELTADDSDCRPVPHHDTVSFIFEDSVLVRLKKADMALRSSNYPTEQAQMFHEHERDMFGFSGHQRVEAVYLPNRFDTGIVWSGVVAREKNKHLWHFELTEPVVVPVTTLPTPVQPPAASLARLKPQATKDDKNNEKKEDGEGK